MPRSWEAPSALMATVTAMIASFVVALMITQWARWKISLHLIGMTGAIITLGLVVGPLLFFLAPLILLVGWAQCTHQGIFAGFPPTGKEAVLTGMDFIRIADDKLVELWSSQDTLSWLQQLGLRI